MSTEEVTLTPEEVAIAKKYDLTAKFIPFLDRQLIYPLIEPLDLIYDQSTIDKLYYELIKDTYMIKFIKAKYQSLYPGKDFPKELLEKEEFITSEVTRLNNSTKETLKVLSEKEVQENLKQDKTFNREYLATHHGITDEKILELYQFGKLQYNRGDYVMASDLLNNFRVLSTDSDLNLSATWGRAAAEIISCEFSSALEDLAKLRESIDTRNFNGDPLTQLHNRTWIIHWSLFPYFNIDNGLEQLTELLLSSSYLSTIQASCPWILRYLIAAVIASSPAQTSYKSNYSRKLKDIIKVVQQESYEYQDPLTDFIKSLYVDFDFKKANEDLKSCEVLFKSDCFLRDGGVDFFKSAKKLMAQVYCKIHSQVDIVDLKETLGFETVEETELCIADLLYVQPEETEEKTEQQTEQQLEGAEEQEQEQEVQEVQEEEQPEELEVETEAEPESTSTATETPLILTTDSSIKTLKKSNEPNPNATYQQIVDKIKSLNYKSNQILNSVIPKQE